MLFFGFFWVFFLTMPGVHCYICACYVWFHSVSDLPTTCNKNNNSACAILKFLSGGPCFVVNHTKDEKMYFSIMATLTTKNLGVTNFGTKWMANFFSPKCHFSCQFLHEKVLGLVKVSFKTVLSGAFPTPAQNIKPKINTPIFFAPKFFVVNVY